MAINIEQIWQEYHIALKRFVLSRIDNSADADDLLQDILIKIHKNLPKLKAEASLKPWLFQITQNAIMDYFRSHNRQKLLQSDLLQNTDDNESEAHILQACILPFINALPEAQSSLLVAIEYEGQAQKDFAKANGIAYSTLKSRVKKSRLALRELFENCCHLSFDNKGRVIDYLPKAEKCENC